MKNKVPRFKFRLWIEQGRRYEYGGFEVIFIHFKFVDEIDSSLVDQFIGVLDKNGKEIYEGDIVKYNKRGGFCEDSRTYYGVVTRGGGSSTGFYFSTSNDEHEDELINGWRFLYDTFEVIGNMRENKDLIIKN